MVDQEVVLFSASLRDNITLWNPAVPDDAIVAATRDAQIHHEILRRPQGYATLVEEGGVNFSAASGNVWEIARALVGNPTVIVLDRPPAPSMPRRRNMSMTPCGAAASPA